MRKYEADITRISAYLKTARAAHDEAALFAILTNLFNDVRESGFNDGVIMTTEDRDVSTWNCTEVIKTCLNAIERDGNLVAENAFFEVATLKELFVEILNDIYVKGNYEGVWSE
jgi:hypothetical protein